MKSSTPMALCDGAVDALLLFVDALLLFLLSSLNKEFGLHDMFYRATNQLITRTSFIVTDSTMSNKSVCGMDSNISTLV